MVLTREFKETVAARAEADPSFREALLREAVDAMLQGDLATGKTVLRDYVNATVGFQKLAETVGKPAPSLMRMLGPKGNPRAQNLLDIVAALQDETGVRLEVRNGRSR